MRVTVVPALWGGESIDDVRTVVRWAAAAGVSGVWISEVAGFDAVGLAVAVAPELGKLELLLGPVSPAVRDPGLLAMGVTTVAAASAGPVAAVLGSSSPTIVERWHGRSSVAPVETMKTAVTALRAALSGERTDHHGGAVSSTGFRLSIASPGRVPVVIAAQGRGMLRLGGEIADGVVINLVTPHQVAAMVDEVERAASAAGRDRTPPTAVWMTSGSVEMSRPRVSALLGGYASAPGYRERFLEAGLLRSPGELDDDAVDVLGAFGEEAAAVRIAELGAAGAAEVAVVLSGVDPAGPAILERVVAAAHNGGSR